MNIGIKLSLFGDVNWGFEVLFSLSFVNKLICFPQTVVRSFLTHLSRSLIFLSEIKVLVDGVKMVLFNLGRILND